MTHAIRRRFRARDVFVLFCYLIIAIGNVATANYLIAAVSAMIFAYFLGRRRVDQIRVAHLAPDDVLVLETGEILDMQKMSVLRGELEVAFPGQKIAILPASITASAVRCYCKAGDTGTS